MEQICATYQVQLKFDSQCYKSVQRFRVTCLFTGQYDTGEYGTIAGVLTQKPQKN